ncbi:hypothetical protein QYE76_061994 [Lolium multiflorum]|uniref:F-box domain-containing protein n=1 Tax=Lolium multiflorum TaxID=4521 RepID=A0AAD8S253_LOLMU|nr:hypothetical protein QYE76_061994 [Lolium multiflorum]
MSLPDDIVTEIFSYLPAKSASRFRGVSCAWHATLSSASFIDLHLRRANKPGEIKVFFSLPDDTPEEEPSNDDTVEEESNDDGTAEGVSNYNGEGEPSDDGSTPEEKTYDEGESHDDDEDDTSEEEESHDDDDDTWEEESYFYAWQPGGVATKLTTNNFYQPTPLTRPLHGLVLMRDATSYHICNPCTGATLALPDSSTLPAKMMWRPFHGETKLPYYAYVAYGLGYCLVTHEYKVVRLFSNKEDDYSLVHCEVFVLGTVAYWRPTAQQPPACVVEDPGVFLDGHLHFLCSNGGILTFDVSEETFGSLFPPPNLEEDAPIKMTELDGCLCICHGHKNYGDGAYNIWMLGNYKQGNWERLCRVDPTAWTEPERVLLDSYWMAPLGIYNENSGHTKIMFDTGTCKVFAVDVTNGNKPEVIFNPDETIGGTFKDFSEPGLGLFEESLVPVGRTIGEMVLLSPHTKAWFDILKWMQTRFVADLSLVCRAWRAMVKDDHFIRSHVAHANLNKSPRIMLIDDSTFGLYVDLEDVVNGREGYTVSAHLVCSQPCHGLNAGTKGCRSFVCNPVMGYLENILVDGVDEDTFFAGQTGMGYDSENNIHVLVLVTYKEKNLATPEYKLECKLRYVDDKECRLVDPPPRPVANVPPTYVAGKIFWLVEPDLGPISLNCEIVAFDIRTENFEVLQGPPCSNHADGHKSILQLHGALCMAFPDKRCSVIDIWMMKDGIWSMEYHIELKELSQEYPSERTTPLAVDPTDGRILFSTGRSLGYFDPETAAMETLYSNVGLPSDLNFCPIICDESFVSTLYSFYY